MMKLSSCNKPVKMKTCNKSLAFFAANGKFKCTYKVYSNNFFEDLIRILHTVNVKFLHTVNTECLGWFLVSFFALQVLIMFLQIQLITISISLFL